MNSPAYVRSGRLHHGSRLTGLYFMDYPSRSERFWKDGISKTGKRLGDFKTRSQIFQKQRKLKMTVSKKVLNIGWYGQSSDDLEFLTPDSNGGTNPWATEEHSSVGYDGARWSGDSAGNSWGQGIDGADDNEAFLRPSTVGYDNDYPQQSLTRVLNDQADLPAGKLLGGGGEVGKNGGGPGPARRTDPGGPARTLKNPESRGGRDTVGGRRR